MLTNIYPEHLDHYNGFEGYVGAKYNIMKHQTKDDYLIYNPDQDLTGIIDLDAVKSNKIAVSAKDGEKDEFLSSLSSRTIVYKGMLTTEQLRTFYADISV